MKLLKIVKYVPVFSALILMPQGAAQAQETNQLEQLQKQLDQMQSNFDRVVREQRGQIESLKQQISTLQSNPSPAVAVAPVAVAPQPSALWSPVEPLQIGRGGTYMDVSLVATFAGGGSTATDIEGGTQLGGHDPNQRGFSVQGVEANFRGAVDPYFRGNANVVFLLDSGGESHTELEEAWLETISLPYNLQVRAGQYLTEFGRINTQHPHTWAFVDTPLVNGRLFGADGLRNPGVRVSWLAPTPFYSELFFGVQNSQGETAFSFRNDHEDESYLGRLHGGRSVHDFTDMLFSARYALSLDLTDSQTLLAGASAAFGPNASGPDTDTQIYGVDAMWKWKSPRANAGFPFVSWQTEAMVRRYEAGAFTEVVPDTDLNGDGTADSIPAETLTDWGLYSQVLWGVRKGWILGLRGDYVAPCGTGAYEAVYGPDPGRATRWRISPNLTWYPTEFSKVRLQYNYDDRDGIGVDHSVWLQFEFLLGAHGAHKF